jgi:hypothetical protein
MIKLMAAALSVGLAIETGPQASHNLGVAQEVDVPAAQPTGATQLDDIVVDGRPLREATTNFIDRIMATPRARGAAVWHDRVCLGVGNLQRPVAEALIDRISDVAVSVGLALERPGCEPRVFIVFAEDADAAARNLVETRGRHFRIGLSGADRGEAAVETFLASDRPVRWWQASAPVNAETGVVAGRYPGRTAFSAPLGGITSPTDLGSYGANTFGSRLRSPLRDDLSQVIIIVDIDQVEGVDFGQLADYLAVVSLAQIDPDVDPGPYDSILGLFVHPEIAPPGLTDWDRAFLEGLYGAEQTADNPQSRLSAVADNMARKVREQQAAPAD